MTTPLRLLAPAPRVRVLTSVWQRWVAMWNRSTERVERERWRQRIDVIVERVEPTYLRGEVRALLERTVVR